MQAFFSGYFILKLKIYGRPAILSNEDLLLVH